jgi:organic hydroperoxide reductase OsmC/OhrA
MSLAGELTGAGTPPGRLDTTVTIVMDEVEGQGHQIVGSRVEMVARVDGVDDAALQAAAAAAHAGCPFSQLLERAGAEVSVSARLTD